MKGLDYLGNVAVVKFDRNTKKNQMKKEALKILKNNKNVTTVLEKTEKIKGRLRTPSTKYLVGINTKECLYKENGCVFRLNIDECYFSPRLSNERKEIADKVTKGEEVLVLFGGVAPFAITIAKTGKPARVISIELGKECCKYAVENVKKNKVNVEIIQGDVRKKLPLFTEKFDRIVMARPNLKDNFLDVTFPRIRKGGIVHYYGFYKENESNKLKELIYNEAKKAKKKIKILKMKKAGDIGVRTFRYRADIKVFN